MEILGYLFLMLGLNFDHYWSTMVSHHLLHEELLVGARVHIHSTSRNFIPLHSLERSLQTGSHSSYWRPAHWRSNAHPPDSHFLIR